MKRLNTTQQSNNNEKMIQKSDENLRCAETIKMCVCVFDSFSWFAPKKRKERQKKERKKARRKYRMHICLGGIWIGTIAISLPLLSRG